MSYIHYMVCALHSTITCKIEGARNTMKTPRIYIGALAVFCIAALVIGSSGAAATPQGTNNNIRNGAWQFGPENDSGQPHCSGIRCLSYPVQL